MQTLIQNLSRLFHPRNRKWTIPIVAVVAVALISAAIYYGDYIRYIFTGVKASDIKTWTWDLDNESEYTATSGVTFGPDSASVDLEFTSISSIPPDFRNINDLWYNGTNILGAAVDYDNYVAYSIADDPWGLLPIHIDDPTNAARGIHINRIADGGGFNKIFGLGTTAQSGTAPGNAAVVYGEMTTENLSALNYAMVTSANSFTAGTVFKGRLYGAMSPKTSTDPLLISILPNLTDIQYPAIGTPGQTTSINNFIVVGNRLYATVTDIDIASDWGKTRIWVTEDGTNWTQTTVEDPWDHNIINTSTNSITRDTEGYIYATVSFETGKLNYILKSTQPFGVVFKRIVLPTVPGLINKIYADGSNNIWLPLSSGRVLRSTDYQSGVGATSFYQMNTEINFLGGNTVKITDIQQLSNGKILWAGGIWMYDDFIRGAGWSSRTADPQTVSNKTGIEYFDLLHFNVDAPPVASNNEFRYQIRNTVPGSGEPWYYYDPSQFMWVAATDLTKANTASEVDAHINEFKEDVGYSANHNIFHFQAVYDQADTDPSSYDIVLRSIDLEYLSPAPHFRIEVKQFVEINEVFDITVTALNPDDTVIASFKPNGVDNDPSWALRSNLMSVPPSELAFDDGLLVCQSEPFGSGWNNGVLTYTGCQVATANNDADRWISVSYLNTDVGKIIFDYTQMRVIDVTTLPVGRFQVELLVNPVPPVDDQVFVDQQFALIAEARVGAEYGDFVKTNFVPDPLEGPVKVGLAANGNNAIITPETIGDSASGTGDWANGVASYDQYSVDIAGLYQINVVYLTATGRHSIRVINTPPLIDYIDPTEGPVGQLVKIHGSNFGDTVGVVKFDTDVAHIVDNSWTDTDVEVFAPFKPGSVGSDLISFITLTTADGLVSDNSAQFTYKFIADPAPTVTDIDPNMGSVEGGTVVTITGSNFVSGANVRFGATFASGVNFTSSTTLVATTPAHAEGAVNVTVINPDNQFAISPEQFTYLPIVNLLPIINNINPNHGPAVGGNPVTINGENFGESQTAQSLVKFGGATATINSWSDTSISVSAPAGTPETGVLVTVTTNAGTSQETVSYNYDALPDVPVISLLNPTQGPSSGGTLVTITGSNLGDTAGEVYFGTKLAHIVYWSNTTIRVLSPAGISGGAGIVQVHVVRIDSQISNNLPYEYLDVINHAKAVRYYSRDYLVTKLNSLDSINISAGANGAESNVSIALGLFDATGAPMFVGDDGLGTGYFTLDNDNQSANLYKLTTITANPSFANVRMLRFRIDMYTPDVTADVLEQPWVESVDLGYTLADGTIGAITFADTNTTQYLPNDTDTPIQYNLVATSGLVPGDPTFSDMIIGINWLDNPPVGLHAWVEVVPGSANNVIAEFGPGTVVSFKVFFSSGVGINLTEGSYRFQITGRVSDNSAITLVPSPVGTVLTGPLVPGDFSLALTEADQTSYPGATLTYEINIDYSPSFTGGIDLVTDLMTVGNPYVASAEFAPNPVINQDDQSILTVTLQGTALTEDQTIEFTITGTSTDDITKSHQVDATLIIRNLNPDDFSITVAQAVKDAQPGSTVVYDVNILFGSNFTDDINLSTDVASKFANGNTFASVTFAPATTITADNTEPITLTLVINDASNIDAVDLDVAKIFNITGVSAVDPAKTHNAVDLTDGVTLPTLTINSIVSETVTLNLIMPVSDLFMAVPEICDGTNTDVCDDWLDGFKVYLYPVDATNQDDTRALRLENAPNVVVVPDPDNVYPAGATNRAQLNGVVTIAKASLADAMEYIIYVRSNRHVWTKADLTWTYDAGAVNQDINVAFTTVFEVGDVDALHNNRVNVGDVITTANAASTVFNSLFDFDNNNRVNIGDVIQAANQSPKQGDPFFDQ